MVWVKMTPSFLFSDLHHHGYNNHRVVKIHGHVKKKKTKKTMLTAGGKQEQRSPILKSDVWSLRNDATLRSLSLECKRVVFGHLLK